MEEMEMKTLINLKVNGKPLELAVEANQTLVDLLRYDLGLTGTKKGCETGECGACTVLLNDKPVNACLVLAVQANGAEILTIEGLRPPQGLHPLQQAFVEKGAIQCGFCTPGMILNAHALLARNPAPTEKQILDHMEANLCRCGSHVRIVAAIQDAARQMKGGRS
jgi:aerobic carbon-monoxide dehydrogenase small subunit